MDKEQLAHEYALKALSGQIEAVEKAYLEGFNQALRTIQPVDIEGVKYYDFDLPSGTLWSMPLFDREYVRLNYSEASVLNIPTTEQFAELKKACESRVIIDNIRYLTPHGIDFYGMRNDDFYIWTKSEIKEYYAIAVNEELNPVSVHVGHKRRIMLVKNKYSL